MSKVLRLVEDYTKDQIEENIDFFIEQQIIAQNREDDNELLSTCCGASGIGNIHEYDGEHYGLCSRCKDHCEFEYEEI